MYLSAEKYVGGWDHNTDAEKAEYATVAEAVGLSGFRCDGAPCLTARLNVAYWRKANAIHKWFVDNVQGGRDECQLSWVKREQLQALADLCEEVLAGSELVMADVEDGSTFGNGAGKPNVVRRLMVKDSGLAAAKLPTQSGFFFGGTGYDRGYVEDLRSTADQLRAVLADERFKGFDFYYQSSW
jgi:hypothetical protein